MTSIFSRFLSAAFVLCLGSACSFAPVDTPPVMETAIPVDLEPAAPCYPIKHRLGVIGVVEPVYMLPMKAAFPARIDTGAETSSLDAQNISFFERDGEKWVTFDMKNRETGETRRFEKKIFRRTSIKRIGGDEERTVVTMTVRFGGEIITSQFTLADRSKFIYPVLIGRNILSGLAVVDASAQNTLP